MTTAYLALGSNLGHRAGNLHHACRLLAQIEGIEIQARSAIYETESVEGGGSANFLNAAIRISTALTSRQLLQVINEIEAALGRPQPPRHGARLIDIDILLFGDEHMDTPELQIPHPRMVRRAFVLRPLSDVLEGGWVRPAMEDWE
ncbi:MAG TPA: 2-amino-4-hydroxy-6-hydroxymethyldihydropteridine diphosphokinase [Abditibacteriaceae bacterium]|nr:2-amino-4-hydroxy-6-hydroxymethyldihydropteridine diphosphokinase [Abditibacteriaceae bacterium]